MKNIKNLKPYEIIKQPTEDIFEYALFHPYDKDVVWLIICELKHRKQRNKLVNLLEVFKIELDYLNQLKFDWKAENLQYCKN